jgi:hypothetical protein
LMARPPLRASALFPPEVIAEIQRAADQGPVSGGYQRLLRGRRRRQSGG